MISLATHGGNVHAIARELQQDVSRIIDFSASINPLGLSPVVLRAIQQAISQTVHYPDINAQPLREHLARFHKIPEDSLVVGNGSAELISVLPRALGSRHGLVIGPTFMEFERALKLAGSQCTYVHAKNDDNYQPPVEQACHLLKEIYGQSRKQRGKGRYPIDTVFLCHPNSPTGQVLTKGQFHNLLESVQKVGARLVVDEAFIDYCLSRSVFRYVGAVNELIVLRSFTKFYAIPGLRVGYLGGPVSVIEKIQSILPPWSVNVLASAAAIAALRDTSYRQQSLSFMREERMRFGAALRQMSGLRLFSSSANFFLVELRVKIQVSKLMQVLRQERLLVRDCRDFAGIDAPTIRLAVRRSTENDRLVKALKRELVRYY